MNHSLICQEIESLPKNQILCSTNQYLTFYATAKQIPHLLTFIGHRREYNFRLVGEGTGKIIDIDIYDEIYTHIVAWDTINSQLITACRLTPIDTTIEEYGLEGIYTNSLFSYDELFFNHLAPAIELGRLFVEREQQKKFNGIQLIWSGVLNWLAVHPPYQVIVGCVTISKFYAGIIQSLIIDFCLKNRFDQNLSKMVKPRNAINDFNFTSAEEAKNFNTIKDLSDHIKLIENKSIPILFKKYEALGCKYLSFGLDINFSNAIDMLAYVDLKQNPNNIVEKIMGVSKFKTLQSNWDTVIPAQI
jgi:hypothetical protein